MHQVPNTERLRRVIARIESGMPVCIAAIGGSITTGHAAYPPEEQGWLAQLAGSISRCRPGAALQILNLGVSGTDSATAAHRVHTQAIETEADLVIVEFGVNDQWLDPAFRRLSYEGLLRQLLRAPHSPAVLCLHLVQQANQARDASEEHIKIARHYGLPSLDFGNWMDSIGLHMGYRWPQLYNDEPIHPNQHGHTAIAHALSDMLLSPFPPSRDEAHRSLPPPLYGDDFEYTAPLGSADIRPYRNDGFVAGGDLHEDWARRPGGAKHGWYCKTPGATASFLVHGRQIGLFCAESDQYSDLEAWVDDGPVVHVRQFNPIRQGYLGWAYTPVGRNLADGAHLLHVRARGMTEGSAGFHAGIGYILCAGVQPTSQTDFTTAANPNTLDQWIAADSEHFLYAGRFDWSQASAPSMAWSGCEVRFRFTGSDLALRLESPQGTSYFVVRIDDQSFCLKVEQGGQRNYRLLSRLPPGEHDVSLFKASEAYFSQTRFHGAFLDRHARILSRPAPRRLKLEFYGDSITAGACNADVGDDQYDDLASHDGSRAYGALTARRLDADYLGIAVSGSGLTCSWNEVVLPLVSDRSAASTQAPLAEPHAAPDIVVINLGQNDHGYPEATATPFPADFASHYVDFVSTLRRRYPAAAIVCTLGGMMAWQDSAPLRQAFQNALKQLQREDGNIYHYLFSASSTCHPRLDIHDLMARELEAFLRTQILIEEYDRNPRSYIAT